MRVRHTPIWKKPFVTGSLPLFACRLLGMMPVWITLLPPALSAPRLPRTPPRPSQVVHESTALTTGKQHILVRLERTSTGGTRREAQQAADGRADH